MKHVWNHLDTGDLSITALFGQIFANLRTGKRGRRRLYFLLADRNEFNVIANCS